MKAENFLEAFPIIISDMKKYAPLFYQLAISGEPRLTEDIPTAAVTFDREGNFLNFLFNPKFVEKLSWEEIKFVCCHEMLHILLDHGSRTKDNKLNNQINNIAMDIVINHSLIDNFSFLRGDLPFLDSQGDAEFEEKIINEKGEEEIVKSKFGGIAFIDRTFKARPSNRPPIKQEKNFEYYYNRIAEDLDKYEVGGVFGGPNGGSLDDHSQLPSMSEQELEDLITESNGGDRKAAKEILDKIKKCQQAGTEIGQDTLTAKFTYVQKKRKWESLVANIRKTKIRMGEGENYQWSKIDRRTTTLDSQFLLPSNNIVDDLTKKWDLWLFQDVSGSCVSLYERFIKAARSIPTDVFNVKFHVFDTQVKQVDLSKNSHPGGGGTCFAAIEDYIQKQTKKTGCRYPRLIFIITDGAGTRVNPKYPKNWLWFLSADYTNYIPKDSKVFMLEDFDDVKI